MSGAYEDLNLMNIGNGCLPALFDRELKKVVRNIADPNVSASAAREITIKVKIKPALDLSNATLDISVSSKLADFKGHPATMYLARQGTSMRALHHDPQQGDFFDNVDQLETPQKEA